MVRVNAEDAAPASISSRKLRRYSCLAVHMKCEVHVLEDASLVLVIEFAQAHCERRSIEEEILRLMHRIGAPCTSRRREGASRLMRCRVVGQAAVGSSPRRSLSVSAINVYKLIGM
jgi:hypothetical protein